MSDSRYPDERFFPGALNGLSFPLSTQFLSVFGHTPSMDAASVPFRILGGCFAGHSAMIPGFSTKSNISSTLDEVEGSNDRTVLSISLVSLFITGSV